MQDEPKEFEIFFWKCKVCDWFSDADTDRDNIGLPECCEMCGSGEIEIDSEWVY